MKPFILRSRHAFHAAATRYPLLLAVVFLFAAFLIGTFPYWGQGKIIPMDAKNHFYPMLRWLAGELHAGRFPDFMAETYAGRSTLADPQSMITSPGFLILAALKAEPSILAMDMLVLFELFLGAVALLLIAQGRNLPMLAAFVGALVFMFGGLPISRLQHTLLVQSYAFLPWVLLLIDLVVKRPTLLRGAGLGLAMGLLVLGRDHVAFLSIFVAIGWAVARISIEEAPGLALRRALPAVFLSIFVSLLVALPALTASVAFLSESNRPAFGFDVAARGHLTFFSLLTLFIPDLFGTLDGSYWGPGHWQFKSHSVYARSGLQIYAGLVVPLALALAACITSRRGESVRFGLILCALSLLYGLGNATPAFWVFYEWVPGVDKFRRSSDAGFLFNLGCALVVTGALSAFLREGLGPRNNGSEQPRLRPDMCIGVFCIAGPVVAALLVAQWHDKLSAALPEVALFLLLTGLIVASVTYAHHSRKLRVQVILVLAVFTLVDLSTQTIGTRMNTRPLGSWAVQADPSSDPRAETLMQLMEAVSDAGPMRAEIVGFGGAWQNLPLILDVESTVGYNPFRKGRYDTATGAGQNSHTSKRKFGAQLSGYRSPLTDLLGVAVIGLGAPMEVVDPQSAPFFDTPIEVAGSYFYVNPRAIPRAVLIPTAATQQLSPGQAEGTAALPDLDYLSQALVQTNEHPCVDPPSTATQGKLAITDYEPGQLSTKITVTKPSLVVLHERRRSGWKAWVDGKPRELIAANGIFQAVHVCPGETEVRFAFHQPWLSLP